MKIRRIFIRIGKVTFSANDVHVSAFTLIFVAATVTFLIHPVL